MIQSFKYLLIYFIFTGTCLTCIAKEKIVERSGKKPKWVNSLQQDFIITMATDIQLESAKMKALARVKEQIVLSVADNVKTSTEYTTEENTLNKNVTGFIENFQSKTSSYSGKTDYVQGVSLLKVKEYYWEKVFDKKKNSTHYNYHLKYPFSAAELNEIISEYKRQDEEMTTRLENALNTISNSTSIEEILSAQSQLGGMRSSFVDMRQEKATAGAREARTILQNMGMHPISHNNGRLIFELRYNGKTYTYNKVPRVTSACATIGDVTQEGSQILVNYQSDYCIEEDPENGIDVRYQFGTIRVDKKFRFSATEGRVEIFIKGDILVDDQGRLELPVYSKYENPFEIFEVMVETPEGKTIKAEITDNQSIQTRGIHKVLANSPGLILKQNKGRISGTILYRSTETGRAGQYKFYRSAFSKI